MTATPLFVANFFHIKNAAGYSLIASLEKRLSPATSSVYPMTNCQQLDIKFANIYIKDQLQNKNKNLSIEASSNVLAAVWERKIE